MPTDANAESSTATETPQAPAAEPTPFAIPTDADAYADWRLNGPPKETPKPPAPPKAKTKAAASPAAAEPSDDASNGGESGATSEAAGNSRERGNQRPRTTADQRLSEVLADLKRAGLTPAELKTYKRQTQEATTTTTPAATPQAPQGPQPPKKPNINDFATHELYDAANDVYLEAMIDFRADLKIAAERLAHQQRENAKATNERLDQAKQRYGDGAQDVIEAAAKTVWGDKAIPEVFRAFIDESPVVADLLYAMNQNGDDFDAFVDSMKKTPGEALRRLALMEDLVKQELKKGGTPARSAAPAAEGAAATETPQRGTDGKFQPATSTAPPAKKTTNAPPPPTETRGQSGAPADPVDKAYNEHDFAKFREAANQRDLARGKRG